MCEEYSVDDLVQLSGFSLRTVRFYIQEGLLPGPDTMGKYAHYSQEHLDRLEMIKWLKNMRLPLQEIRQLLESMTQEEIRQKLESAIPGAGEGLSPRRDSRDFNARKEVSDKGLPKPASRSGNSALDYIKELERAWGTLSDGDDSRTWSLNPALGSNQDRRIEDAEERKNRKHPEAEHKTWRRIEIADGVELHLRDDQDLDDLRVVSKLIAFVKNLSR